MREPGVDGFHRRVRDDAMGLFLKHELAMLLQKRRRFQACAQWFAPKRKISLFTSPVGQVEYLPTLGSGVD